MSISSSATLSLPNALPFCLVSEFLPYVFQVLSLLLEIRQDEIPAPYMELFPLLLSLQCSGKELVQAATLHYFVPK